MNKLTIEELNKLPNDGERIHSNNWINFNNKLGKEVNIMDKTSEYFFYMFVSFSLLIHNTLILPTINSLFVRIAIIGVSIYFSFFIAYFGIKLGFENYKLNKKD